MHQKQLLACLEEIDLPEDGYCVFGGACLAVRNIRPTDDIDLYVTPGLYDELKSRGWQEKTEPWPTPYLTTKVRGTLIEIYKVFENPAWQPKFQQYLIEPEIVGGYKFMPLQELYEWKAATRRPKDSRDLKLIDDYWLNNH